MNEIETGGPAFPTMLRKMWSGAEVQEWINENWHATQRQPLTQEQIDAVYAACKFGGVTDFARAIEAALGITGEKK